MPVSLKVVIRPAEFTRFRRVLKKLRLPGAKPIYDRALRRSAELVAETTRRDFLSGQSLAVRSGRLRRSIVVDLSSLQSPGRLYVDVGSAADVARYAGPHEFGWPGKNIRANPFLQPGLAKASQRFEGIWVEEMEREIGRVR